MRTIAVLNQKGGVGKTTLTANLGHALAIAGHKVTLIDMDPQGHLGACYGHNDNRGTGIGEVMLGGKTLAEVTINVRENIKLIPAGAHLGEVERLRDGGAVRGKLLQKALGGTFRDQDYILFDCPPASGLLITNVLIVADEVLTPVTGDYLALQGLSYLMLTLKRIQKSIGKSFEQWIALSRIAIRRRITHEVIEKLAIYFPEHILQTAVSEAAVLAECPGSGRTIFEMSATSRSAREINELAEDLALRRTM